MIDLDYKAEHFIYDRDSDKIYFTYSF